MAKENTNLNPEELRRKKEREELELREKEEEARRIKEKEERKKEREKREKKREQIKKKKIKEENKRIRKEINFPYKVLFNLTLLISLFAFIIIFFVLNTPIYETLLYMFFIFSFLYLGIGGIMIGIYYLIAIDKRRKFELEIEKELKEQAEAEARQKEEELAELEELERSASSRKELAESSPYELPGSTLENSQDNDESDTKQISDSSESIEEIPENSSINTDEIGENIDIPIDDSDDSIPEFPSRSPSKREIEESSDEDDYIAEIMGEDFKKSR